MTNKPMSKSTDKELEELLQQFRSSVHSWSAQQYAEADLPSPIHGRSRSRWTPFAWAWRVAAGACSLALIVAIPLAFTTHHDATPSVAANHPVPITSAPLVAEEQEPEQREASSPVPRIASHKSRAVAAMSDEELMAAIDQDVSQRSPDAMSPLVALMSSDSSTTTTQR